MQGLIGKKDVLKHPGTVIHGFGWKVFIRTLAAPPGHTFLEIISEGIPHPTAPKEIELSLQIDKLVSFELRCAHIYARLAEIFRERWGLARDFFRTLSEQEEGHAEILRITKVELARRRLWNTLVPIDTVVIEKTDKMLSKIEWALREPEKLDFSKALQFVEEMESSEINIVFDFLLHSVSSPFLKKIYRLIPSIADHKTYLNSLLPVLKEEEASERNMRHRNSGS